MPKGKITMAQLSDSLKYKINNANGSIGLTRCTTLLTVNSDRVLIDTTLFNKNVDVLLVFKNTTFLQEIEDYTISEDGKYILSINGGIWEASEEDPVVFNFVIFKAISAVGNHIDGKLLIPNSIDEDKLSQDLIEKIQAGGGGGSINVNKYTKTATSTITEIALEKELTKRDTLLVFSNSVYLEEGDDYKVSDTKNSIVCLEDGGWTASEKSPRVFNFVVLTSVPGSNEIEPGSIDETLLNEELKEKLNKVAMSAIGFEKHTSEITTASTSVPIGAKFNRDTDVLIVFDNSTYLEETEDYIISSDGNSISPIEGEWVASIERPRIFNFIIFKALPTGANKIDGALISNNTILETCLEQGVIDKLNSANNIKTSIGNLEDETLPEDLKNKTIIEMVKQNFTNANNGKELITNVVGAPLLATDTFQQQKDKIQTIKNNMANKLIAKGLSASGTETMTNLTNKIANIEVGDYKKGQTLDSSKYTLQYATNKLDYYKKHRFITGFNATSGIMDATGNIFSISGKYYDYNKDEVLSLEYSALKFSNCSTFYDYKNDAIYCYAINNPNYTEIHISKINKWTKIIKVAETEDENYSGIGVNTINIINSEQIEVVCTLEKRYVYDNIRVVMKKYLINANTGNIIDTKVATDVLTSTITADKLLNIDNTSKYCYLNYETKVVTIYDSNLKQIESKILDNITYSTRPIRAYENNYILCIVSNDIIVLHNYNNNTETVIEHYCEISLIGDKHLLTFNRVKNTITKYKYNNGYYEKISTFNLPLASGYSVHSNDKMVGMYQGDKMFLFINEEQVPSSITLK